jgi:hypothetical protein
MVEISLNISSKGYERAWGSYNQPPNRGNTDICDMLSLVGWFLGGLTTGIAFFKWIEGCDYNNGSQFLDPSIFYIKISY